MEKTEERFANALHGTARAWRLALDRRLKSLGVSQASWLTIAVAAKAPQPLSQSELAERLGVEGATLVAMVDRLAKAGLVSRELSASDRRIKHVVVSQAGYRLFDKVTIEAAAFRRELLGGIEPRRLEAATLILEELQRKIEAAA